MTEQEKNGCCLGVLVGMAAMATWLVLGFWVADQL